MNTTTADVLDCGHPPIATSAYTPGIVSHADGTTLCYSCADNEQRQAIADAEPGHRTVAYLDSQETTVITWSGGRLMGRVVWGKAHPFSRERRYFQAIDDVGRIWRGVGCGGMYCRLTLTKQTTR